MTWVGLRDMRQGASSQVALVTPSQRARTEPTQKSEASPVILSRSPHVVVTMSPTGRRNPVHEDGHWTLQTGGDSATASLRRSILSALSLNSARGLSLYTVGIGRISCLTYRRCHLCL
jgi:hypothetical protein